MTDLTQAMMRAAHENDVLAPRDAYDAELLLTGTLVKLGAQFKSWRSRWFAAFGDGNLRYFKSPPGGKSLKNCKSQGQINMQRDIVELMTWSVCQSYMKHADPQFKGPLSAQVRWPQQADKSNGFAIRTTYRTYYMYNPDGEASYWIDGLTKLCSGSDVFIGVDQTSIDAPEQRSSRLTRSQPSSRSTSPKRRSIKRNMSVPASPHKPSKDCVASPEIHSRAPSTIEEAGSSSDLN